MKSNRHHHREICYSSVEQLPQAKGTVLFDSDSSQVFKDDIDITPQTLSDGTQYMPWVVGGRRESQWSAGLAGVC